MAKKAKRKSGGVRRTETESEKNARARRLLRQNLRERQAIQRLSRQVTHAIRAASESSRLLLDFLAAQHGYALTSLALEPLPVAETVLASEAHDDGSGE